MKLNDVHEALGFDEHVVGERRLYLDFNDESTKEKRNAKLNLLEFTLVNCPKRNQKETLDKHIIVDLMHFAHEKRTKRTPASSSSAATATTRT